MLDQTFSARNFKRVYDSENRKGRNVDKAFFPDLVEANLAISATTESIRDMRKANVGATREQVDALVAPLYAQLRTNRAARDVLVDAKAEEVSRDVRENHYQMQLRRADGPNNMTVYPIVSDPCSYFIGKQLQRNISALYKVKSANRRQIIDQLRDILATKFRTYVVRTDISTFYESIDRSTLIREIDADQLLSLASKSFIKKILASYASLSQSQQGIPRGVGISAYLAELYMRSVDEQIRQIPTLTYYARYVDDIIAIFSPSAVDDTGTYLPAIEAAVQRKGLAINVAKTRHGQVDDTVAFQFEYLGYGFNVAGGHCRVDLSGNKVARYRLRLDRSFAAYNRERHNDQRGAARRLLARIKFLTGNTRLVNNKRQAFTGVYYTNSQLSELGRLRTLDGYLTYLISTIASISLRARLSRHAFVRGFTEQSYYRYSTKALSPIVEAWRYAS